MSDEERSAYVNRNRRPSASSVPAAGERSYTHGGSGNLTRKVDSPAAWLRTPTSRSDANQRGGSRRDA